MNDQLQAGNSQASVGRPLVRLVWLGALAGGLIGFLATAYYQLAPRLSQRPNLVFFGLPHGLDQYTYAAIVQAIWRSPTLVTYSYPFALPLEPVPPVLFHLSVAVISLVGRILGLIGGFEFLRIVGSALTGAALVWLTTGLVRRGPWLRWALLSAVVGGGMFAWTGMVAALRISGPAGLTELWEYPRYVSGPFNSWAPFLLQNLAYPLECFYHALVLGALGALIWGRLRLALLLNILTWASNPFPSIALNAAVLPWLAIGALAASSSKRRQYTIHLGAWLAVAGTFVGYHEFFLKQWPLLEELMKLHRVPLAPPPKPYELLGLIGPYVPAMVWSAVSSRGRHLVWVNPRWRLVGFVALTQLAIVHHGYILREAALQPYHFDRGYMHIALCLITIRALTVHAGAFRHPGRLAKIAILLTMLDQPFWFWKNLAGTAPGGRLDRPTWELVEYLRDLHPDAVVHGDPWMFNAIVAATTHHRAYSLPESDFIPHGSDRAHRLEVALSGIRPTVAELGIYYYVTREGTTVPQALAAQGWEQIYTTGAGQIFRSPALVPSPNNAD